MTRTMTEPRGWVFYDGSCPICRGGVDRFHRLLHERGYGLAPLQTLWVQKRLNVRPEQLLDEMRVLTHDGKIVGGADGLIYLAGDVWWAWPLYIGGQLPLLRSLVRSVYRWVAKNRYCLSGTCRVRKPQSSAVGWLPLILLPALTVACRASWAPWIFMWTLSISIWIGFKWLTWWRVRTTNAVDFKRSVAYLLFWPGMDAEDFLLGQNRYAKPTGKMWMFALGKAVLGASLLWGVARWVPPQHSLLIGWVGLFGLIFLLHFGTFHLAALFWQTVGLHACPIMRNPLAATSLSDFWSSRWNLAFRQLAHRLVFQPLHKSLGPNAAMFIAFLGSGLIHDLVISLPARGGYGLPTLYFVLQGMGLAIERSGVGRRCGLREGFRGWAFALLVVGGPAFWLFHPLFVIRIVVPFMAAIGAL